MDFKDIKSLSVSELTKKRNEVVKELFQARMKNQLGQLGNPVSIRFLRKDVARYNTAISLSAKEQK